MEFSRTSSCLEAVCGLFQKGQIQASPAYGNALDGYRYVGALEKTGWTCDVWVKQLPGTDRVLTIFRDLNEKAEGPYGKPNFTGNFMVAQSPPPPAGVAAQVPAPQASGGVMNTVRQGVDNVKHGAQLYGRQVTGTVASLGGFWGTLNTSISTIATLPGGATIIGVGAAVAGAVGYGVGTAINQIPVVQQGTQSVLGGAFGYNTPQEMVNLTTQLENQSPKALEHNAKNIADNMKKFADSGAGRGRAHGDR